MSWNCVLMISPDTQNMALNVGGSPGWNSVLVLALPFDCCVILHKSLNFSGLFAYWYTKGLDLMTLWGQRLVPREAALGVWVGWFL